MSLTYKISFTFTPETGDLLSGVKGGSTTSFQKSYGSLPVRREIRTDTVVKLQFETITTTTEESSVRVGDPGNDIGSSVTI